MEDFIIEIMNSCGYIGVFLLICLENLFPPIPSEVILTFGGFMTIESTMTILGVVIVSTLGSLVGAIILYYIGKLLDKDRLIKIVSSKYGKLLSVKPKDIDSADAWFSKKGNITVFFCRFVPVVRSLISIPAGMSKMNIVKFVIYTIFGSAVWNTVLIYVGAFAYDKKDIIFELIDKLSNIVLILMVVIFFVVIFRFLKKKDLKQNK